MDIWARRPPLTFGISTEARSGPGGGRASSSGVDQDGGDAAVPADDGWEQPRPWPGPGASGVPWDDELLERIMAHNYEIARFRVTGADERGSPCHRPDGVGAR